MRPIQTTEFPDYLPGKERRSVPIPNFAVTALTQEIDPTQEIRTLIEQLQQTARDARGQLRAVEHERDEFAQQLQQAVVQVEELRANERELRSHFTEVSTILRDRDRALEEGEQHRRAAKKAQDELAAIARERGDAQRQRDEAVRQRDDSMRRLETLNRSVSESGSRNGEVQKQLVALRQARDAAHTQNLEQSERISRLEDAIAELEYQRDAAIKSQTVAQGAASEYQGQLETISLDRDAAARQVEELGRELDAQRRKLLDLGGEKSVELQAGDEHAAALVEALAQVASLAQERDAARQQGHEQARELEELRAQFQAFRDEHAKVTHAELAGTHEKLAAVEALARQSRHEAANLKQERMALHDKIATFAAQTEDLAVAKELVERQLGEIREERETWLTSLQAAQKQIEHLIQSRDIIREQATDNALELEAQLFAVRGELEALQEIRLPDHARDGTLRELQGRCESQRLESIELAAKLQVAQRQIRELGASLAEARLQLKFANSAARALQASPEKVTEIATLASRAISESQAEASLTRPAPLALGVSEALSEPEAKRALTATRHCFQSFSQNPTDLSLLHELYCHVNGFAERARVSEFVALHRLCQSFAELIHGLFESPERINTSTLRTVNQTIDFLAAVAREKNLADLQDPAQAHVYTVDDDFDNCMCMEMVMQQQMMRTSSSQDPSCALMELAENAYDLIFLDVNMPGLDGFELCRHIRELPLHRRTPIVFLTGVATAENRLQSTLCGGNDFVAKPFDLHEISVKALTLILKTQLRMS
ncbi:MAG: hypothetical protein QOE70_2808 [Chthoniobacter sp.]|jgi:CheY-like chemotaxis protein/chromosome segregation ATPase|nr:hypothetical protein [Chthoniobacter sp.]